MKYTKFTHEMDVFLLESLQVSNPMLAPHGSRLAAWKELAETLGTRVCNNPTACTWQICRDRAKALLHMHEHGQEKKLFKNSASHHDLKRKEALIVALRQTLPEKRAGANLKKEKPAGVKKKVTPLPAPAPALQPLRPLPKQENSSPNPAPMLVPTALKAPVGRKRKEMHVEPDVDARLRVLTTAVESKIRDDMETRATDLRLRQQELEMHQQILRFLETNMPAGAMPEKLVELIERKMSFDMEHRKRDLELRQAEIIFQNQLLRFLTHGE
ncbi:hypothetical protein SPRG_02266 [Saprolegnia parasitica CBS 223.65]|uniref:Uncharacterized protein n=1 Tax=Saprolegnia parasitica (strain CBS 223.65) TaxID=695850 RepID=A0A067CRW6_SAPPC|nr:hypothetical protein SPRG_02266 [Saprolegnia parasitica CBS 223.65]KDO33459.1 hypothetical protein SPRG_02266 [Saprolegnia parasitica CBS 223.65]|eukprot:XP_012196204.1 hypothetical protein SPRG_02266 [Saprolegnia parasitica CBS 223.65]